jgi:hypothetical protein
MTREDYLDAVIIVALALMFGPVLYIMLIYALTGYFVYRQAALVFCDAVRYR